MDDNIFDDSSNTKAVTSTAQTKVSMPDLDNELADMSPLLEVRAIELLPELFGLLLEFDRGDVQTKDFDNSLGTVRLKISLLIQKLQNLDGICDSIADQKASIEKLKESIRVKAAFSSEFNQKVLSKLDPELVKE